MISKFVDLKKAYLVMYNKPTEAKPKQCQHARVLLLFIEVNRAVDRLRQRRRPPPLILGQESKNSRMQENTLAVRILRIGQQISPPPFLRSGYGPGQFHNRPTMILVVSS